MRMLFLALSLAVAALPAMEEEPPIEKNVWEESGAYVKLGIGGLLIPIMPTLGFGYYAKVNAGAIDFSALVSSFLTLNILDIKLLALPVIKEKFQFGAGLSYLMIACDAGLYRSLGVGLLFRKTKPHGSFFFQLELTLPIFELGAINAFDTKLRNHPLGIDLMWGYRF